MWLASYPLSMYIFDFFIILTFLSNKHFLISSNDAKTLLSAFNLGKYPWNIDSTLFLVKIPDVVATASCPCFILSRLKNFELAYFNFEKCFLEYWLLAVASRKRSNKSTPNNFHALCKEHCETVNFTHFSG